MKRFITLMIAFTIFLSTSCSSAQPVSKPSNADNSAVNAPQVSQNQKVSQNRAPEHYDIKYVIGLPPSYQKNTQKKYPLFISLHGAGKNGTDLSLIKPPKLPKDVEYITVSPQCPDKDLQWTSMLRDLNSMIDKVIAQHRVDTDRIYLSGTSMGGAGTWYLASLYPERFAAIGPIAGYCDPQLTVNVKSIPVWAIHGAKDTVIPLEYAQQTIDALNANGGNVKFSVDPEAGHDAGALPRSPEFIKWFGNQTLKNRPEYKKITLEYDIVLPDGYNNNSQQPYPLIFFLGNDQPNITAKSIADFAKKNSKNPFIVISPKLPEGMSWKELHRELIRLLDNINNSYKVDPGCIYLTGEGKGGNGAFYLGSIYPERFTAIAIINGVADRVMVQNLYNVPLWCFNKPNIKAIVDDKKQDAYPRYKLLKQNIKTTTLSDNTSILEQVFTQDLFSWFISYSL